MRGDNGKSCLFDQRIQVKSHTTDLENRHYIFSFRFFLTPFDYVYEETLKSTQAIDFKYQSRTFSGTLNVKDASQ